MEKQNQETQISLPEVSDWIKTHFWLLFGLMVILSLVFVSYLVINGENFKKNACQLCEDSGRKCFEPIQEDFVPIGYERIDNPFKINVSNATIG
jgi:hypothetical protein